MTGYTDKENLRLFVRASDKARTALVKGLTAHFKDAVRAKATVDRVVTIKTQRLEGVATLPKSTRSRRKAS